MQTIVILLIHNRGGGKPHENMPPYYVLAWIMNYNYIKSKSKSKSK